MKIFTKLILKKKIIFNKINVLSFALNFQKNYKNANSLSHYLKINDNIKLTKYNYSIITYFSGFILKRGNKLKTYNSLTKSFSNICFNLIFKKNQYAEYLYIEHLYNFIQTNKNVKNINFLLGWYMLVYSPIFDIKCINNFLKKKKNAKKRVFKLAFISENKKTRTMYKHISLFLKKNNCRKLISRIEDSFCDIFFNYKKSYLYKRKLFIYKKVISLE